MTDQGKAYACALCAVAMWSTVASAFKLTLGVLKPVELLLYSTLVSTLLLFGFTLIRGTLGPALKRLGSNPLRPALMGLMNPALYYLVLFKAYDLLPAQAAQPLNYTWAITLSLLSVPLLKQKLRSWDLAAILVGYSGVVVISTGGSLSGLGGLDPLGVALALGSTVIWALYWILSARDTFDPVAGLFLNFLFGSAYVLAFALATTDLVRPSPLGLFGAAYVGVVEMGLAFVLWLTALKLSTSAAKMANLIYFSPFLSLVLIHFLVGEHIRGGTIVGLGLIIAGTALQQAGRGRSKAR